MTILNEINSLIILTEDEYYRGDFIDRHKGKILAGAGLLGAGVLAHSGALGSGAQNFVNTNLKMLGQGAQTVANKLGGASGVTSAAPAATVPPVAPVAPVAPRVGVQAAIPITKSPQINNVVKMEPDYSKVLRKLPQKTKTMGELFAPLANSSVAKTSS